MRAPAVLVVAGLLATPILSPAAAALGPAIVPGANCGQSLATGSCREDCGDFPCCHTLWILGQDTRWILWCEI